jgi:hypothetical protein
MLARAPAFCVNALGFHRCAARVQPRRGVCASRARIKGLRKGVASAFKSNVVGCLRQTPPCLSVRKNVFCVFHRIKLWDSSIRRFSIARPLTRRPMLACLAVAAVAFKSTPTSAPWRTATHQPRTSAPLAQYPRPSYGYPPHEAHPMQQYGSAQQGQQHDHELQDAPLYVRALSDHPYPRPGELGFRAGDAILLLQRGEPGGWWQGSLNGQAGWFPSNYCSAPHEAQQSPSVYTQQGQDGHAQQDQYGYTQQGQYGYAQQGQYGYAQHGEYRQVEQDQYGHAPQQPLPPREHDVFDPRSTTQTYEQWLAGV